MRSLIKTLVVISAFLAIPLFSSAQDQKELVTVVSTKRYIFHFKVDKSLIGGTISVVDGDYKSVLNEPITHKQNIIDFFELPAGHYTIKIKKDELQVVLLYENFE